jgi:hypothetical protein
MRLYSMLFLCSPLLLSCKRDDHVGATDSSKSAPSLADEAWYKERPDRPLTVEEGAKLMSGFAIDIQPTTGTKGLVLRFRFRDPAEVGKEVPLIQGVRVEKAGEKDVTCEVKSAGYLPLAEWNYNEEPSGFQKLSCKPLDRGEYDVIVYGYYAQGEAHLSVGGNGAVTRTR